MKWKLSQTIELNYKSRTNIGLLSVYSQIPQNNFYQNRIGIDSNYNFKILKKDNEYLVSKVKLGKRGLTVINLEYLVETNGTMLLNEDWGLITPNVSDSHKILLAESKYWRKTEKITSIVEKLKKKVISKNGNKNLELKELAKIVFDFVKETIIFKENQSSRFGASKVLELKYGDCDEFSDLFIAICRNMNIPARRVTGYFLKQRENKAEAHAWAEILDMNSNKWIPIDPALNYFGFSSINHVSFAYDNGFIRESFVWSQKRISGHLNIDISPLQIL